jgi:hypothetical protein
VGVIKADDDGAIGTKALTSSRNKRPATRRLDHYFDSALDDSW